MYTHEKNIIKAGLPASEAKRAIIMIHGRGASAESIISLADHLNLDDAAIYAPQASNHSWYPYSFMAPVKENQPALDSALQLIGNTVLEIVREGISVNKIYFLGFSQGACLSLEYVTRNAAKYGGVVAFTGGLIGQELKLENYKGNFEGTPILVTTGDPDPHVPVSRVEESIKVIEGLNGKVTSRVYRGRPHTIQLEEINLANEVIFKNDAEI